METRKADMLNIAAHIENLLLKCSTYFGRHHIHITYDKPTVSTIECYSDWTREYHGILTGEEYFIVSEDDSPFPGTILYAVNVTGDSLLTAAEELMHKVASKF